MQANQLLKHKGYKGTIEFSEEDQCYFGQVLGLKNALVMYEGNSKENLEADFKSAVDEYLEHIAAKREG